MKEKPRPILCMAKLCRGLWICALLLVLTEYAPAQFRSPGDLSRLTTGIDLFSQGKWHEAVLELRRFQVEAPSGELQAEALFWISVAQVSAGEYEQALRNMDVLEETDPNNQRIKELLYHRGRALYFLERYDEAILLLKLYADAIPEPNSSLNKADMARRAAAFYWIGECLFSMGQLDRAGDIFRYITEEYPGSPKFEASIYRLALIDQKKVEIELLALLRWSHEESLRNMEEYRRRESSYDQALNAYQKRIADILKDSRMQDLENENARYREQLQSAEERIRSLENSRQSGSSERLNSLRSSAQELENRLRSPNARE
jgi:TolA-binding protein